jgi:hypothetical protein
MRGEYNCVLTTQFCSKIVVRLSFHSNKAGVIKNMLLMVHGFFGKFAQKEVALDDVIEVKISDKYFYSLINTAQKLGVINKPEQSILDELVSKWSNILPCKIHSIILRAIIRRCNLGVAVTQEKRELESIALVIQTAQRYQRDAYFI